MKRIEDQFGAWVIQWRWLIIIATLAFVTFAFLGTKNLVFTNDYRVFFGKDNPQLLAFDDMEQTYNKNDNVLFVLAPKDGNAFTAETLQAVHELTEQSWQIPYSTRVNSISNFQYTYAVGDDDLIVEDLILDPASITDSDIARIRDVALKEPNLVNNLISASGHVTGVNVTISLPGINESTETPEVTQFSRNLVNEFEQRYPNIEIYLTGMAIMNNAFGENSLNDMTSLIPLSFLLMLIMLAILTRAFAGTAVTFLVIGFSIITGMGLGGYLGFPITGPSTSAPIIILTIAIANSVHILMTLRQRLHAGADKKAAITESLRINLQPIFLASLTTCIGFLSLNFSDAPPFRDLGNFTALGVAGSFFFATLFMPALLSLLPMRARQSTPYSTRMMQNFAEWIIRNRQTLLYSVGAVILVLIALIPKNELNDVFVEYFSEEVQFRVDTDFSVNNLNGIYRIDYSFESSEPEGISNPEYLIALEKFTQWWRAQPEIRHVNSLADTMKRLNKNMHSDNEDWYRIPDNRELSAQYLLLYEMSLPYGLDLNNQVNIDKSATRISVTLETMSSNDLLAIEQRAQNWLLENTPTYSSFDGTGPSIMFANIGKRNIESMLIGTTLALIGISIILIFAFRSPKIGLLSLIPNLIPAAMGFGIWGLMVGQIGLSLSVVTGMTLGIIVDDTVHLLSKYLRARRENNADTFEAVRYSLVTVGPALLITSIILVLGFLVLTFSNFYFNSSMGLLTAIIIAMALIADFLFFLPLLMKAEENCNENITNDNTHQPANV
ncbi:MAG: MMPL family transporter [Gammaproteobacteria bacterium]|nr:MMPL family transporter [Gammaproteobacteria bacterium]